MIDLVLPSMYSYKIVDTIIHHDYSREELPNTDFISNAHYRNVTSSFNVNRYCETITKKIQLQMSSPAIYTC